MEEDLSKSIEERIELFKNDLLNLDDSNNDDVLNHFIIKWIIEGDNFYLNNIYNKLAHVQKIGKLYSEIQFKYEVAQKLGIPHTNVIIMGSSKNGFSLKPDKTNSSIYNFNHFRDCEFKKNFDLSSDIDLTIIDSYLFDKELENIYNHTNNYRQEYLESYFIPEDNSFKDFSRYILRGWIKPDLLPNTYNWSERFDSVAMSYQRKFNKEVTIALFKSWEYFMAYNRQNIKKINLYLRGNL